jgi:hypothetical protein
MATGAVLSTGHHMFNPSLMEDVIRSLEPQGHENIDIGKTFNYSY